MVTMLATNSTYISMHQSPCQFGSFILHDWVTRRTKMHTHILSSSSTEVHRRESESVVYEKPLTKNEIL